VLNNHSNILRSENGIHKDMSTVSVAEATRILSVCYYLHRSGIAVPPTVHDAPGQIFAMPYLSDLTAFDYVNRSADSYHSLRSLLSDRRLNPLIPLADLHKLTPPATGVRESQPWKSIKTRLNFLNSDNALVYNERSLFSCSLMQCYTRLQSFERSCSRLQKPGQHLIHGDFHFRQVLLDPDIPRTWLIDLDDICIGHREQDIGNLVAHLVTSIEIKQPALALSQRQVQAMIVGALKQLTGCMLDSQRLAFYTALALLRRALKFICSERYRAHRSLLSSDYSNLILQLLDQSHRPTETSPNTGKFQWKK